MSKPPAERAVDLEAEVERLQADLEAAARDFFALKREHRETIATLTAERDAVVAARNRDFFDAVAAEREYCAQLANWHLNTAAVAVTEPERLRGYRDACADIETAIRARGAK